MNNASHRSFESDEERMRYWQVAAARSTSGLVDDACHGLLQRPRSLPPKYFYDARGTQLFEAICTTPEYYPARTEATLLEEHAAEIIDIARPAHIVEFGSGSSNKVRNLLDACEAQRNFCTYWPFDMSAEIIVASGQSLITDYPWLGINGLVGDYQAGLRHLPDISGRRLFTLLGGTIGDFTLSRAIRFLIDVRQHMRAGDWLLLSADRDKDPEVLHAAYNDKAGLTARFNLNLLQILNWELQADFDTAAYDHEAHYNDAFNQIEMYLTVNAPQKVHLAALERTIEFDEGERILTKISRKFTRQSLLALFQAVRFSEVRHYEPDNGYTSLVLLRL